MDPNQFIPRADKERAERAYHHLYWALAITAAVLVSGLFLLFLITGDHKMATRVAVDAAVIVGGMWLYRRTRRDR